MGISSNAFIVATVLLFFASPLTATEWHDWRQANATTALQPPPPPPTIPSALPAPTAAFTELTLIAFKDEQRLEVWGRDHNSANDWQFHTSYPFTANSGVLGPKLRQGDRQIPEGIYHIEYFNPHSNYHLSMKINYPNRFDKAMARYDGRRRLGGDIFIHGKAETIGCIPIGDEAIEQLYRLASTVGATRTKVIITPFDLRTGQVPPQLPRIDWEQLLYRTIATELQPYRLPG